MFTSSPVAAIEESRFYAAPADSRHVWYTRFYDFNVQSEEKIIEKLRYMHRNPVRRGLVDLPEKWAWSSFVAYWSGAQGVVWIERLNPNPTVTRTDRSTFDGPTS